MDKPQPKFKPGDTVRIKDLPDFELRAQSHGWLTEMDQYIGQTLTINRAIYRQNTNATINHRDEYVWVYIVHENNWTFEEYVLEPYTDNCQLVWI
jgi:hypothetical protein|nr:MAG TPA: Mind bomb SH3 repeat domain [Caudoviricetes sp.]